MAGTKGKVHSINISKKKGIPKTRVEEAELIEGVGINGDVHAGPGDRQVSLLSIESIKRQAACPKAENKIKLGPGDFAENITTEGIDLSGLKLGDILKIGARLELEVSKIGKECHRYCAIYYKTGDCIMPKEGIFARVLIADKIKVGDVIEVIYQNKAR